MPRRHALRDVPTNHEGVAAPIPLKPDRLPHHYVWSKLWQVNGTKVNVTVIWTTFRYWIKSFTERERAEEWDSARIGPFVIAYQLRPLPEDSPNSHVVYAKMSARERAHFYVDQLGDDEEAIRRLLQAPIPKP